MNNAPTKSNGSLDRDAGSHLVAPNSACSIEVQVRIANVPGTLGRLCAAVGDVGGNIGAADGFDARGPDLLRNLVVLCRDAEHQHEVVAAIDQLEDVELLRWRDRTFSMHDGGKIETTPRMDVRDNEDLSMAYTPGVARVCLAIADDPDLSFRYTVRKNTVAIVSDGTAVLGLGDIGPQAAMPVMEGKALLFKSFAGVDAYPICLDTTDPDEIVETVRRLAPSFGGINLEDIAAPGAFEIESRLKAALDIPVFHDDQHGTAVVTLAALKNALRLTSKDLATVKIVISGIGAAGVAIAKILLGAGATSIVGVDSRGAIYNGRPGLNSSKQWFAENTNTNGSAATLSESMVGADVFVGVSAPDVLTIEDIRSMAPDPIVFAMANPDPEIRPELVEGLTAVMATGRSDYPNQINNVLAFPGIFRGALDVGATDITENMKLAAADAISGIIPDDELSATNIVPSVFDPNVLALVAPAVSRAALDDGVGRLLETRSEDRCETAL